MLTRGNKFTCSSRVANGNHDSYEVVSSTEGTNRDIMSVDSNNAMSAKEKIKIIIHKRKQGRVRAG